MEGICIGIKDRGGHVQYLPAPLEVSLEPSVWVHGILYNHMTFCTYVLYSHMVSCTVHVTVHMYPVHMHTHARTHTVTPTYVPRSPHECNALVQSSSRQHHRNSQPKVQRTTSSTRVTCTYVSGSSSAGLIQLEFTDTAQSYVNPCKCY